MRPIEGWLNQLIVVTVGSDPMAALQFAVGAMLLITVVGSHLRLRGEIHLPPASASG